MKKTIFYLAFALLISPLAMAQEFEVGTNVINGGIGFGGYYGYDYSSYVDQSPVFSVSYERGVWDIPGPGVVSLGGYFGRKNFKYKYLSNSYNWAYNILGVRGAYHYNGLEIDNLDVYAGVMASYNVYSGEKYNNYNSRGSVTPFIGGRWFFTDSIAVYAEGGYGVAFLTVGASFRF